MTAYVDSSMLERLNFAPEQDVPVSIRSVVLEPDEFLAMKPEEHPATTAEFAQNQHDLWRAVFLKFDKVEQLEVTFFRSWTGSAGVSAQIAYGWMISHVLDIGLLPTLRSLKVAIPYGASLSAFVRLVGNAPNLACLEARINPLLGECGVHLDPPDSIVSPPLEEVDLACSYGPNLERLLSVLVAPAKDTL